MSQTPRSHRSRRNAVLAAAVAAVLALALAGGWGQPGRTAPGGASQAQEPTVAAATAGPPAPEASPAIPDAGELAGIDAALTSIDEDLTSVDAGLAADEGDVNP